MGSREFRGHPLPFEYDHAHLSLFASSIELAREPASVERLQIDLAGARVNYDETFMGAIFLDYTVSLPSLDDMWFEEARVTLWINESEAISSPLAFFVEHPGHHEFTAPVLLGSGWRWTIETPHAPAGMSAHARVVLGAATFWRQR